MVKNPVVFTFETGIWDSDAPEDAGKGVMLWTPILSLYPSAELAAESEEGLNFVEGDIKFFAADGSSLVPAFSQEPYINSEKNTYFAGVYTLVPAAGKNLITELHSRIEANVSPHARIMIRSPLKDEGAASWGWPSAKAMKLAFVQALKILPPDLATRVNPLE
ncbi:MAG: hypothetical protein ACAH80_06460 [Alphaproteobacteria bacterium]